MNDKPKAAAAPKPPKKLGSPRLPGMKTAAKKPAPKPKIALATISW
jgi:hypothetical protein